MDEVDQASAPRPALGGPGRPPKRVLRIGAFVGAIEGAFIGAFVWPYPAAIPGMLLGAGVGALTGAISWRLRSSTRGVVAAIVIGIAAEALATCLIILASRSYPLEATLCAALFLGWSFSKSPEENRTWSDWAAMSCVIATMLCGIFLLGRIAVDQNLIVRMLACLVGAVLGFFVGACLGAIVKICVDELGPVPGGGQCMWIKETAVSQENWGHSGQCPRCGFAYRWDGVRCCHCGLGIVHSS